MNKQRKVVWSVLAVVIVIVAILITGNKFYIDYLWFSEMGYLDVFFKELVTKLTIGVPLFIILVVLVYFYLKFLKRLSEKYLGVTGRIATRSEKRVALVMTALAALVVTTTVANGIWNEVLLYTNSDGFGITDALYGMDLSFYFFSLPLFKAVYSVVFNCFILMVVLTFLYTAYVLYRENDYTPRDLGELGESVVDFFKRFVTLAGRQIGVFLGAFFILLGLGQGVNLFEMVYGGTGMVYGAGASDIIIGQKFLFLRMGLCVIFAVTSVIAGIRLSGGGNKQVTRKNYILLAAGPVLFIAVAVVGTVIQAAYEYVAVVPNQYVAESPYLGKNIEATRKSYGLDNVVVKEYAPTQAITAADVAANSTTISNIPINDPGPTKEMYNSLQGIRNYYKFDSVDVDRYTIDGTYTQVFLGAREMDNQALSSDAKSWINLHLKYTHGFGVAMSPVNQVNAVGQPELMIKDIPPVTTTKSLSVEQPRIYFGEGNQDYVVVGASSPEFDYPKGDNNEETWYNGTAGIKMSFINRLAFALYTGSPEMLFTSEITGDSRILLHRNVMERIKTIAPFLEYDDNPYIVLVGGKQYWIADAFVKSDKYPYATPYDKSGNNYLKNSVKVVVDAYNGDVSFYQVEDEPITNTYSGIFPDLFKSMDEMPEGLRSHLRYSKTLFDVQSGIYSTYHMTNPQVFYNKEDQWDGAKQFYGDSKEEVEIESSYIIMKLPDRDNEFMLTKTFTPSNKDNMIAWLAGVSDGADYGQLLLYQFPKQALVYGPMQIEQRIDQDTVISPQLTLLGQQGSKVLRGNMMTIPIEEGLIYVEPVYLQASGGENNLPELKKVIVSDGDAIVMADTLGDALSQVFNYTAAKEGGGASTADNSAAALVNKANTLYNEATEAQKNGDWATYGSKLSELQKILSQLTQVVK